MNPLKTAFMSTAKAGFAVLKACGIDVREMAYKRYVSGRVERAFAASEPPIDGGGITIAAEFDKIYSIAQVGRDFLNAISKTAIPFSAFNVDISLSSLGQIQDDERAFFLGQCSPSARYRRFLFFVNQERYKSPRFSNAITPFWEFDNGMENYLPALTAGAEHVVAFSDFNYDYFKRIAPRGVQVHKIRYPFAFPETPETSPRDTRASLGIKEDDFVVFFHFSSGYERKNPEGVVEAFCKAGLKNAGNAKLVIKATPAVFAERAAAFHAYLRRIGIDNVIVLDGYCSRRRILELIAASSVYISLHRGEGFGIGMLEAMSVGTPVVATNYGGNTDFCTEQTSFPVPSRIEEVPCRDAVAGYYKDVKNWAEPDIEAAAEFLGRLQARPEVGLQKARNASLFIAEKFSNRSFEDDVVNLLREWRL